MNPKKIISDDQIMKYCISLNNVHASRWLGWIFYNDFKNGWRNKTKFMFKNCI